MKLAIQRLGCATSRLGAARVPERRTLEALRISLHACDAATGRGHDGESHRRAAPLRALFGAACGLAAPTSPSLAALIAGRRPC